MLTIALSKGRILKQTLPLLKKAGLKIPDSELNSRKLILDTNINDVKVIIVRATDVPIFVQHGAADIGIVGKDILLEYGTKDLFEMLDLGIAKCQLMLAASDADKLKQSTLKVATKYVNITKHYFEVKNQSCEIIKLYGAIELAPVVGLAHCVVDLVETGNTLKANGLTPLEHVWHISSRLVVNVAALKTKNTQIKTWINNIEKAL